MIQIRSATAGERGLLEALQMRASLANDGDREAILAHPESVSIPEGAWVFVAEDDARLGFAAVLRRDDGDVELDGLFVEPALWRSGVGKLLVQHCVQFSRELGAAALHVVGNSHAEAFYLACGFDVAGVGMTQFGPSILMTLEV